jgi:hypothetical protein
MEKINKKIIGSFFLAAVLAIALCSLISAFGFSSLYTTGEPLAVYPGEVKDFNIKLKSSSLEGDLKLKAELLENAGIAKITDSSLEYAVTPTSDGIVNVRIEVPANTPIGRQYNLTFLFSDITPKSQQGTVTLTTSSRYTMGVIITEKPAPEVPAEQPAPEKSSLWLWIVIIIIIIAAVIIVYYILKKRKASE